MIFHSTSIRNHREFLALIGMSILICGCAEPAQFKINAVEVRKQEIQAQLDEGEHFKAEQIEDIGSLLIAFFGTPDEPNFVFVDDEEVGEPDPARDLISLENLKLAAGPVSSDESGTSRGLYREHCAHCHGVSGGGGGPTGSFLNPYPRDFRHGKFKFKSTPIGIAPTKSDLKRIIRNGISGTGMPAFKLLPEDEIDALVDYVIYLSIRGQMELRLIESIAELGADDPFVKYDATADDELGDLKAQVEYFRDEIYLPEVDYWLNGIEAATPISKRPESLEHGNPKRDEMLARGRELFMKEGNCFSCHGYTALGDGQINKYDYWTEDWLNVIGGESQKQTIKEFEKLGAFKPRPIRPRNLRQSVFRGGNRPIDIFWRLRNGIDGSPMPAAPETLTDEDIWCLVEYVQQIPRTDLERVREKVPENTRILNY